MTLVAGVDFGTLTVRVSILDEERGRLGFGSAPYELHRKHDDPDYATQRHEDHMDALAEAMRTALAVSKISGKEIASIAVDTTGSSVIPVGENLTPLDDYYLWCDHRAWREAELITKVARELDLPAIHWSGDAYSTEWGFSKLLHWFRNNPDKRAQFMTALEHCDMAVATLCGLTWPSQLPRSICAMGHKWLWNEELGGLPSEEFLTSVDPLLAGVRANLAAGRYATSTTVAGYLADFWADRLGLKSSIPIPVGALDAHWDAIGAGASLGDVVNVIGTSTCVIGTSQSYKLVPGVCGVVRGSVHPNYVGIEAGLSATGDVFDAIARRAQTSLDDLFNRISAYKPGQTGMLRLLWDNGDRTVLVNPELGGVILGWKLTHTAEDELFAAVEGAAFHTRIILERMEEYGTPVRRVINAGGISRKSSSLNQIYADVLGKPIQVPQGDITGLGSAIFAFLCAGVFRTIEDTQAALCPAYEVFEPRAASRNIYTELFEQFRATYFSLGNKYSDPAALGRVLPALKAVAESYRCEHGGSQTKACTPTP